MRFLPSLLLGSLVLWTLAYAQDAPSDSSPSPPPADNPAPPPADNPAPPPADNPAPPPADNPAPPPADSPAPPPPPPPPPPSTTRPCSNSLQCFNSSGPFAFCRLTLNPTPGTAPGSCDVCSRNCTFGQFCSSGVCVPGCLANAHCNASAGEVCSRDQGTCGCVGTSCGTGKFCDGNRKCQVGCIVDAQCNLVSAGETCQVQSGQPFGSCVAKMRCDPACPKGQQCFNGECGPPQPGCNITSQNNCSAVTNPLTQSDLSGHTATQPSRVLMLVMTSLPVIAVAYMF